MNDESDKSVRKKSDHKLITTIFKMISSSDDSNDIVKEYALEKIAESAGKVKYSTLKQDFEKIIIDNKKLNRSEKNDMIRL